MTLAIVVVFGFGISKVGSFDAVIENAQSMAGYFSLTQIYDPITNSASPYGLLTICSMLAWGLGYFGMPHVLLRFMAIEDAKKLKLSRRVATVWVVISMVIAVFIGVVGNAMTKAGVIPVLDDPETIILVVADLISRHGFLAAIVAGLILAGILAATMSTADSQLLAASSSASQNILKEVFVKDMSEKTGMVVARVTVTDHCSHCHVYCKRFRQLCIPDRLLCVGRLWCLLRTAGTAGTVLEAFYVCREP